MRIKWKRSGYGSERLDPVRGVAATVSWAITGKSGWVARAHGNECPEHFDRIEDAKAWAEEYLTRLFRAGLDAMESANLADGSRTTG